jgi:putative cardiolipin synthase
MSSPRPLAHVVLLSAGFITALVCGCATLDGRVPNEPTTAYADTQGTALAHIATASLPIAGTEAVAPSGLRLLPRGEFAFDARVAMAQHAERSIDAQYYQLQSDHAGRALLRALRDAAARGVRVRLLIDDFHAAEIQDLLLDLSTQEHVQVRLFNPLPLRKGWPTLRLLLSPGSFELHNHRMHNKLFVADNTLAIFGGRNIADEYFMSHPDNNFVDLDVLAAGPVVGELSKVFDAYWNSELAWPVQALLGKPADDGHARARFDAAVRDAAPAQASDSTDPLGQSAVSVQIASGRLALVPGDARVHADAPSKALEPDPVMGHPGTAMRGVLDAMAGARRKVGIMSPYFVPGPVGLHMMRAAAQQGVRTVLYTNSLASSDEPLVHHRYADYRVEMLRIGVQINEFSPALVKRSRGFGFTDPSTARLHAKVTVVDDTLLVVGSVNLDPRSAIGNTEMSVVIESPALVAQLHRLSAEKSQSALMYRLRLQADGETIEWISSDERGHIVTTTDEPGSTPWLRLQLWLQSLLVDERLL